ncbi:hypothetical protein F8M41_023616 [Gigaspora margarita]|uniref:Uncharacterized protein n=1 Tax=Gigaspora margarita TaxID=4874 RepID=A0A8H4EHA3_GIGMA|nr:hypothetical protein F8M41_023616 [Gigaspora margarita]
MDTKVKLCQFIWQNISHHDKKEYKKAWTIFSEIDTSKFTDIKKKHNKVKFTARLWMMIYILEGYYKPLDKKIDENLKDLYLFTKANAFFYKKKDNEGQELLLELCKNKTEYKYGAKYLIALNSLKDSNPGFKKDEELAYKNYKEIFDHHSSNARDYFISKLSNSYLCIEFASNVQPMLTMHKLSSLIYTIYSSYL